MTDEITPALTDRQWRNKQYPSIASVAAGTVSKKALYVAGAIQGFAGDQALSAIIALANAALPDDSPHKITRADVAWIRSALGDMGMLREGDPEWDQGARIAAKLAALLPPEGE